MLKLQIEKCFQNAINCVLVKLAIKFELQKKKLLETTTHITLQNS